MIKLPFFIITCLIMMNFQSTAQTSVEIGNLVIENIPAIPDELRERLSQYQNTRGATPSSWSPGGDSLLLTTRFGETNQIHLMTTPGGARHQVTFFREPVGNGSFCPNSNYKGFMFVKDKGGDEFRQLHWFDLQTGIYKMISDGGRTQNSNVLWSEDGTQFIYTSTRRNRKDYDLYLGKMSDMENPKAILEREGRWEPLDWSADGKKVLVRNYHSINRSYLHILDLATGETRQVNPSIKYDVAYASAIWNTNATGIFYLSDEGGEFMTLRYYDVQSEKSSALTGDVPWDVEELIVNPQRNSVVFSVNENGAFKLYKLDVPTKKYQPIAGLPTGLISPVAFHPEGTRFALSINSPGSPSDTYTFDLANNKLTRWTSSEVGGLDKSKFPLPTLIEYPTFDKVDGKVRKIPAFYYQPKAGAKKMPVVIDIHGGPEGQTLPVFDPFRAFLVNELGIAVIEPNVRGSSGYGKSYLKLDNGYKREESVKDIGMLLDWIATQPELDPSRVAVMGGSYGGYMVLASLTNFNDRLRCAVDIVGISNFVTFLQNTEEYRRDLRRAEYGDERDPKMKDFLTRISPANNAKNITKPLLIVQGLNDPRVAASESEQMKTRLRAQGNEVWYLLAKDEGHGFRKKENSDYQQLATILFLQKFLVGDEP